MIDVVERFLNYVKFDTKSDEENQACPSSKGQLVFGNYLVNELLNLGLKDAFIDENGYIMATIPANTDKAIPTIGFIAHMDTSPDMSGTNVNPKIIDNYDGKDIILNKEKAIILSPTDFPELKNYIGNTLITTDGTTLLGADDKAGIAEIISVAKYLLEHPEIKHGEIKLGFTPDEEVGRGADLFNVEKFNAKYAYTVDGGALGELEYENFNAASAKINIQGRNVHPGYAKNKMINSITIGYELLSLLNPSEVPELTEKYEGFYHIVAFNGSVENTNLHFIIRDFDKTSFENRKATFSNVVASLNSKYGDNIITLELKDQYYNMKEKVEPEKHIVDIAFKAMEMADAKPKVTPIRGGTDGARLSFMGLPTPNLFTGGENFHGKFEYISVESMEKSVSVIINIIKLYEAK